MMKLYSTVTDVLAYNSYHLIDPQQNCIQCADLNPILLLVLQCETVHQLMTVIITGYIL
jgi:hypothetical protein